MIVSVVFFFIYKTIEVLARRRERLMMVEAFARNPELCRERGGSFRMEILRDVYGVLRPCGGEAPERRGFLSRLPEMARTARQGRCVRALVPWREGEPFPIPELFCFASVGQGRVTYLFDGEGRPIMPK